MNASIRKRAVVLRNDVATFRRWSTTDGVNAIVQVDSQLGLPRRYLLTERSGPGEVVLSRHRTKAAALKALYKRRR